MNFPASKIDIVKQLYRRYAIPLDKLPYTGQFEQMLADFAKESKMVLTLRQFYTGLLKLRKSGKLGKLTRRTTDMKFILSFKTPDVIDQALENIDEEDQREGIKCVADKFLQHGEYLSVEFDTETQTATVKER